ncbi:MAG: 4-(cytidine 5'-diphospho)-2-C-methyl-D-erythritol kinase [Planctomycetes bacterium]|nr:4-(cytidine 5'-diphospho)-2-C-methyl-D-erythritol kinase [Planctomycetota bacterium]MBI3844111.1 4-(cytidine 5'-diphospho)-2-C-methyl-D-erythritol kinase [Planctomycetota bacterium]
MRLDAIAGGFRVRVPAKLNLWLEVLGDRPDGFHEIESIFHSIVGVDGEGDVLADQVEVIAAGNGVEFSCATSTAGANVPSGPENLAHRAAEAVLARAPRGAGLRVRLRKGIPAGSGLGGGSSDAAAVLVAGSRLLGLDSRPEALLDAAAAIGSDVPFFLRGGTALVRGRGEIVEPIPCPRKLSFVVIVPAQFVSTKEIYDTLPSLTRSAGGHKMLTAVLASGNPSEIGGHLFNRLESVVIDRYPIIRSAQHRLQSIVSTPVRVTGSGSALYFVCGAGKEERHTLDRIIDLGIGMTCVATSEPAELAPGAGTAGEGEGSWRSPRSGSS